MEKHVKLQTSRKLRRQPSRAIEECGRERSNLGFTEVTLGIETPSRAV
jgi:hypothetical protein